jgi:hypothetical protein
MEKRKRTRRTIEVNKLVSSTEFSKRKNPGCFDSIKVSEEKTLEQKIERKERNKAVKFESVWDKIQRETRKSA